MAAIGIGVVSGLLTTLLVVVVHGLWVKAVEPWYEERVYKDARVEGRWIITYAALTLKEAVTLTRRGHCVSGDIVVVEGPDQGKLYRFDGTFKNLILTGTYSAKDGRSLDRGTYTVLLQNNGASCAGASAFYEDASSKVAMYECDWNRDPGI